MTTTVAARPRARRAVSSELGKVLDYLLPEFAKSFPDAAKWLEQQRATITPTITLSRDELMALSAEEIRKRLQCE